ncbi:MAG: hypothetical protein IH840_04420 [Candidatus Heimdallarchaeota archaeon]|nr:hypothetical protein [Candidatus Heimdallarchaeota archaeon]
MKQPKINTDTEAQKLLKNKYLKNLVTSERHDIIWRYLDGVYCADALVNIRKLYPQLQKREVDEIIDKVKRRTYRPEPIFDQCNKIAFDNVTYRLNNNKIEKHSPSNYLTRKLPVKYDNKATCPNIEAMLTKMFRTKEIQTIYELIGYSFYPRKTLKANIFLCGKANTGKSTLVLILRALVGDNNCVGYGIHAYQPNSSKYALAHLKGKLMNIGDDISNRDLKDVTILKWITGGRVAITVRQIYTAPEEIDQLPLNIFCANELPAVPNDDAFYNRCVILESKHVFPEKDQDAVLRALTTPEELSGLLNKVLKHLPNLMKRGHFQQQSNTNAIKKRWQNFANDEVQEFIQTHLIMERSAETPKIEIYKKYREFCKSKGIVIKIQTSFGRSLKQKINEDVPFGLGSKKIKGTNFYVGIRLK